MTSDNCKPEKPIVGMASRWRTMTELLRVTFSPDTTPGGGLRGRESKALPQNVYYYEILLLWVSQAKSNCQRENTRDQTSEAKATNSSSDQGIKDNPNMVLPLRPQLHVLPLRPQLDAVKTTSNDHHHLVSPRHPQTP